MFRRLKGMPGLRAGPRGCVPMFFGSYRLYNSALNIDGMFHSVEEYASIMGQARGVPFPAFFARGPDS